MLTMLIIGVMFLVCSCDNSSNVSNGTTDSINKKNSEENFISQYNLLMDTISYINTLATYVGNIHSLIWKNVSTDDVVTFIGYVRENKNFDAIGFAFGRTALWDKDSNKEAAQQYVDALAELPTKVKVAEELYSELNKTYGKEYNIDDLKNYYIESSTFADYAVGIKNHAVDMIGRTIHDNRTANVRLYTYPYNRKPAKRVFCCHE